jgi:uncharacterized membrane protein YidH (DUF202 family)
MNPALQAADFRNKTGPDPGVVPVAGGGPADDDRHGSTPDPDTVIIDEAKLILAEKRTSMALMRTGIAVFALPLSVLSLLIATSRYYDVVHVMHLIIPLAVLNVALLVLGTHLVTRALRELRHYDRLINRLKKGHSKIGNFLK